jgi:hypothetical protein
MSLPRTFQENLTFHPYMIQVTRSG